MNYSNVDKFSLTELESMSKEELIKKFIELQATTTSLPQNSKSEPKIDNEVPSSDSSLDHKKRKVETKVEISEIKPVKQKREFDMSKYSQRKIALKVAYVGWNYMGLASQGLRSSALPLDLVGKKGGLKQRNGKKSQDTVVATIEDYLFKAMQNCKLVVERDDDIYSRCGRTDKGVSGLSQVVALKLRSSLSAEQLSSNPNMVEGELPYADMINKTLPEDIKVISWAPVSDEFDARFDCTSRSYKYFFMTQGTDLDLAKMQEACDYLVGSHDFRNFCRQDGSKQITNFTRDIFEARIQPTTLNPFDPTSEQQGCYELYVRGSGFLWHMIRCIMGMLFAIGQKVEAPELIKQLLDAQNLPEKPIYEMASPYPLVLFDCEYNTKINWQTSNEVDLNALARVYRITYTQWYQSLTKAYHYSNLLTHLHLAAPQGLEQLRNFDPTFHPVVLGAGTFTQSKDYIPVMNRNRAVSVEERNRKWRQRKNLPEPDQENEHNVTVAEEAKL